MKPTEIFNIDSIKFHVEKLPSGTYVKWIKIKSGNKSRRINLFGNNKKAIEFVKAKDVCMEVLI